MANFSLSIDLSKIPGVKAQTASDGKTYVCIPVVEGDLFMSEKGGMYLSVSMWAKNAVDQYGHTHGLKQSLSKERRAQLGEAARSLPFIGSAKVLETKPKPVEAFTAQAPSEYAPVNPQPNNDLVF